MTTTMLPCGTLLQVQKCSCVTVCNNIPKLRIVSTYPVLKGYIHELPSATRTCCPSQSLPDVRPRLARGPVRKDGGLCAADVINLDLEDSVAPSDKDSARENVIAATHDVDWGKKTLSVRINGLDSPFWYRDVVDLLERGADRLDQIMIPKAGCAADIYAVDALVTSIEAAKGRQRRIGFEVIIESAAGISHVAEIAAASPRLTAMSLGAADFAASMGMSTTGIGGTQENYYMLREGAQYWSDPWHWAQSAIVAACRTHGVLPVDGPFGDFSDDDGFPRAGAALCHAGHGRQMGDPPQAGGACQRGVHPVRRRRGRGARNPRRDGTGQGPRRRCDRLQGPLVDIASIKQAEVIVRQAEMIAA